MYIVLMKRVSASEARKLWFRLLDEALDGEVIVVERRGRRVILKAEDAEPEKDERQPPDYSKFLQAPDDLPENWHWEWSPGDLRFVEDEP
jgi:hypothetical protein